MISDKAVAREISTLMLKIGADLDASLIRVQQTCPEEEFNVYREVVANVMTTMLLDCMNPLYEKHPDLMPPELRE